MCVPGGHIPDSFWVMWEGPPIAHNHLEMVPNVVAKKGLKTVCIAPTHTSADQEKTTFTCLFGTYAYRPMHVGLCNAPATFQRCMTAIFSDFCENIVEVFMDEFSVYEKSFDDGLSNLDRVLQRCEETNLLLNWEK